MLWSRGSLWGQRQVVYLDKANQMKMLCFEQFFLVEAVIHLSDFMQTRQSKTECNSKTYFIKFVCNVCM